MAESESYVSIFLQPGWVHEDFYGWRIRQFEPGRVKVLSRTRFGIAHALVIAGQVDDQQLQAIVQEQVSSRALFTFHDLCATSTSPRTIGNRALAPLADNDRMLNIATFVIDLASPETQLWNALGGKSRNMVRRAEAGGLAVNLDQGVRGAALDDFLRLYADLARRKKLRPVDGTALQAMHAGERLVIATVVDGQGSTIAANVVYTTGVYAYFLFGASRDELPPGAGQLAHWRTILFLKEAGFRWYDLGGVIPDPANGIYRFKASLGGVFYDLGREFRYTPPIVANGLRFYRWMREAAQRRTA